MRHNTGGAGIFAGDIDSNDEPVEAFAPDVARFKVYSVMSSAEGVTEAFTFFGLSRV